jgi:predicted DnaQ family exonuclease/DinG family helicase
MYISLDIETTGLNKERDDIIEIGAVKFNEQGVHDKYQTFIYYDEQIPELVTHITSIKNEDLEGAPSLQDVADDLYEFLGDLPIVGHNIAFDLDFLVEKGFIINNQRLDTLPLTQIIKPGLPTYSLDMLTEEFKIEHKEKHRAQDDAIATSELFNLCVAEISKIDKDTLARIKEIVSKSNWGLKDVFLNVNSSTTVEKGNGNGDEYETGHLNWNKDEILKLYEENGAIPDYEKREPQIRMTEKIIDAFTDHKNLLIEAGTGTGKSLAYLLPAIYKARSEETKVVIATHTKNLQDQLFNKDIPLAHELIKEGFKCAVLKGRNNYLSGERLNQFMQKSFFYDGEVSMLIKVLLWKNKTKTGDKEELSLQGREYFNWLDICCDGIKCPHNDAKFSHKCYLNKAREKAAKADVIITNHSLLLSDTIGPSQILPEYKHLIIDEAHHLENEATNALTITITNEAITGPINNLKNLLKREPELVGELEELESKADIFFGILGIFYEKFIQYASFIQQLTLADHMYESIEWERLSEAAQNTALKGEQVFKELHAFSESIDDEDFAAYVQYEMEGIAELMRKLSFVVLEHGNSDFGKSVCWVFTKYDKTLGINCAPVQVREHLRGTLLHDKESIILTSATLSVDHKFDYIKYQLGLDDDFEAEILPSHFKYEDQVEVVIYKDLRAPNTPGYFEETSEIIKQEAIKNGGRMLVLFTAKKAIEATFLKLTPELKNHGISILAQNMSGGRNKIIELFKKNPENSIIFGTNSFWEGVDIKGEALNTVIIQKLPFDPPNDPIHSARGELFDNPFFDYQVPRAILRFKQGFGRLIRSAKDKGRVIVLDSRVLKKSYGEMFLNSLPEGVNVKKV